MNIESRKENYCRKSEELARQIATRIRDKIEYPGQIKVTIIRESRFREVVILIG